MARWLILVEEWVTHPFNGNRACFVWLGGKELACQCRRCGKSRRFDPWVGKMPWRRK